MVATDAPPPPPVEPPGFKTIRKLSYLFKIKLFVIDFAALMIVGGSEAFDEQASSEIKPKKNLIN